MISGLFPAQAHPKSGYQRVKCQNQIGAIHYGTARIYRICHCNYDHDRTARPKCAFNSQSALQAVSRTAGGLMIAAGIGLAAARRGN